MNLMLKRACCVVIHGWVDDLLVIRAESKPAAGRIPKSEDLALLALPWEVKAYKRSLFSFCRARYRAWAFIMAKIGPQLLNCITCRKWGELNCYYTI